MNTQEEDLILFMILDNENLCPKLGFNLFLEYLLCVLTNKSEIIVVIILNVQQ